jgi:glycosyltransferase involved in cell wall biosynthesis
MEQSAPEEISVIIPTWNRELTILRAIESALSQTHGYMEVLVCDDGSTDSTEEIVRSIKDNRLKWLPGRRSGLPSVPRNRGIESSSGDWLAFLDSDDEWMPEKLEKQMALLSREGTLACSSNAYRATPQGGGEGEYLDYPAGSFPFSRLLKENLVICSSVLLYKPLALRMGGFPESSELRGLEDYALWLRVATECDFFFSDEPLLYYRDDPEGSVRKYDPGEHTQRMRVLTNFLEWGEKVSVSTDYLKPARHEHRKACLLEGVHRLKSVLR